MLAWIFSALCCERKRKSQKALRNWIRVTNKLLSLVYLRSTWSTIGRALQWFKVRDDDYQLFDSDDSLLLPTTDVSSPAAGGACKETFDIKKLAEVAERLEHTNLEQETNTLADVERALRLSPKP